MKKKVNKKRKICFVSGSRADYRILSGLIELASNDKDLKIEAVVIGQHVSKKLGSTYKESIGDKFTEQKLTCKRSTRSISPMYYWDLLGKTTDKKYFKDDLI